jgi:hypothetical protein
MLESSKPISLDFRRIGYRVANVRLEPGGDTLINVVLAPTARTLAEGRITAQQTLRNLEMNRFYERLLARERGSNSGHFITLEEIEWRKPPRLTQLFGGLPGVKMSRVLSARTQGGSPATLPQCMGENPECMAPVNSSGCPLVVLLNGQRLNNRNSLRDGSRETGGVNFATGIDNIVGWSSVGPASRSTPVRPAPRRNTSTSRAPAPAG